MQFRPTDIDLKRLLPTYFQNIIDFREIMNTEDIELKEFIVEYTKGYNNLFVQTADDETLKYHEELLGLSVGPDDSLETRRARILARYQLTIPYTTPLLKQYLNLYIGLDSWTLNIDVSNYFINVGIFTDNIVEILNTRLLLLEMVPAHLDTLITIDDGYYNETDIYVGTGFLLDITYDLYYEFDIPELTYTVTYHPTTPDATGETIDTNSPYKYNDTVTVLPSNYTYLHHTLIGWSFIQGGFADIFPGDTFQMPSHDVDLYAVWLSEPSFKVTYDLVSPDEGTGETVDPNVYYAGDTVTILENGFINNDPTAKFIGWSLSYDGSTLDFIPGDTYVIEEFGLVLYAVWEYQKFNIFYHANSIEAIGNTIDPNSPYRPGISVRILPNQFELRKHIFKWWSLTPDGTGATYFPGDLITTSAEDIDLYAIWEEINSDGLYINPEFAGTEEVVFDFTQISGPTGQPNVAYKKQVFSPDGKYMVMLPALSTGRPVLFKIDENYNFQYLENAFGVTTQDRLYNDCYILEDASTIFFAVNASSGFGLLIYENNGSDEFTQLMYNTTYTGNCVKVFCTDFGRLDVMQTGNTRTFEYYRGQGLATILNSTSKGQGSYQSYKGHYIFLAGTGSVATQLTYRPEIGQSYQPVSITIPSGEEFPDFITMTPDERYLAFGTASLGNILIYELDALNATLIKTISFASQDVNDICYSETDSILSVGLASSPYISLYRGPSAAFAEVDTSSLNINSSVIGITTTFDMSLLSVQLANTSYPTMFSTTGFGSGGNEEGYVLQPSPSEVYNASYASVKIAADNSKVIAIPNNVASTLPQIYQVVNDYVLSFQSNLELPTGVTTITSADISGDGNTVFMTTNQGVIVLNNNVIQSVAGLEDLPYNKIKCSDSGEYAVIATNTQAYICSYNSTDGFTILQESSTGTEVNDIFISASSRYIGYIVDGSASLFFKQDTVLAEIPSTITGINSAEVEINDGALVVSNMGGSIIYYSLNGTSDVQEVKSSPISDIIAIENANYKNFSLFLRSSPTYSQGQYGYGYGYEDIVTPNPDTEFTNISLSRDARFIIFSGTSTGFELYKASNVKSGDEFSNPVKIIRISQNGEYRLAITENNGSQDVLVHRRTISGYNEKYEVLGAFNNIVDAALSPDGNYIALISDGDTGSLQIIQRASNITYDQYSYSLVSTQAIGKSRRLSSTSSTIFAAVGDAEDDPRGQAGLVINASYPNSGGYINELATLGTNNSCVRFNSRGDTLFVISQEGNVYQYFVNDRDSSTPIQEISTSAIVDSNARDLFLTRDTKYAVLALNDFPYIALYQIVPGASSLNPSTWNKLDMPTITPNSPLIRLTSTWDGRYIIGLSSVQTQNFIAFEYFNEQFRQVSIDKFINAMPPLSYGTLNDFEFTPAGDELYIATQNSPYMATYTRDNGAIASISYKPVTVQQSSTNAIQAFDSYTQIRKFATLRYNEFALYNIRFDYALYNAFGIYGVATNNVASGVSVSRNDDYIVTLYNQTVENEYGNIFYRLISTANKDGISVTQTIPNKKVLAANSLSYNTSFLAEMFISQDNNGEVSSSIIYADGSIVGIVDDVITGIQNKAYNSICDTIIGDRLFLGSNNIEMYDVVSDTGSGGITFRYNKSADIALAQAGMQTTCMKMSPNGSYMAVGVTNPSGLILYSMASTIPSIVTHSVDFSIFGEIRDISISNDGRYIYVACENGIGRINMNGSIPESAIISIAQTNAPYHIRLSTDSSYIYAGYGNEPFLSAFDVIYDYEISD